MLSKAVFWNDSYRFIVADEGYVRFAKKIVFASLMALLVGVAAVVYAGLRRWKIKINFRHVNIG